MAIFVNNQPVQDANNVGQFGATAGSIGAYKQAAEYARDAEYWANIAKTGINGLDAIVKHVEDLYAQGAIQQSEIAQLRIDFANQNSTLNTQIAKVIQSTNNADTKVNQMDSKLKDVDARLQKLSNLTIDVKELPSTGTAYGTFDNTTAHFEFGIPKGDPGTNGKDGSVTDLNNTTTGIPVADDIGFYVDHTNNTVHRAKMSDIAQTFPSVPFIPNNVSLRAEGGNGVQSVDLIKVTPDNNIHIGDADAGIQGLHLHSQGKVDIYYTDGGIAKTAPLFSQRYPQPVAQTPFATIGDYSINSNGFNDGPIITGENANITKMTGLTTITSQVNVPDPVGDYNIATKRYVDLHSGGGSGASLTGVMNNFIGATEWFNGPRNLIPAGYEAADGKVLSRLKYPDLATAIDKGMLNSQPEATWIHSGDVNRPYAWRSSFSQGGAAGTAPDGSTGDAWFRVPDLNGAKLGSIKHLFLSGSSNAAAEPSLGQIWTQSSPDIYGDLTAGSSGSYAQFFLQLGGDHGAFVVDNATVPDGLGDSIGSQKPVDAGATRKNTAHFNASKSNSTYGRGSQYQQATGETPALNASHSNIGDLYPNHAVGIWIIRVSGAFESANSTFSVLTDTAATSGALAGGQINSTVRINGGEAATTAITSVKTVGDNKSLTRIWSINKDLGGPASSEKSSHLDFTSNGDLIVPQGFGFGADNGGGATLTTSSTGAVVLSRKFGITRMEVEGGYSTRKGSLGTWGGPSGAGNLFNFDWDSGLPPDGPNIAGGRATAVSTGAASADQHVHSLYNGSQPDFSLYVDTTWIGRVSFAVVSDKELKKDIVYRNDIDKALSEVSQWKVADFTYKERGEHAPEKTNQFGFIANDLIEISPEVVKGYGLAEGADISNPEIAQCAYRLDETAIIAKLTQAIQALTKRVEELEAKLESK